MSDNVQDLFNGIFADLGVGAVSSASVCPESQPDRSFVRIDCLQTRGFTNNGKIESFFGGEGSGPLLASLPSP